MTETTTISVHVCDVCGEHAAEGQASQSPRGYYVEGFVLAPCETCGLLACHSCADDGHCCERRAEIESEGLPKRARAGQIGLCE